ncbi:hypothetical protein DFJ77DRAFT_508259 [Powellomyces hirtus]|nr:hypothetical protein DFJ77DRAFT_508259 [Powellomyces hirtus]
MTASDMSQNMTSPQASAKNIPTPTSPSATPVLEYKDVPSITYPITPGEHSPIAFYSSPMDAYPAGYYPVTVSPPYFYGGFMEAPTFASQVYYPYASIPAMQMYQAPISMAAEYNAFPSHPMAFPQMSPSHQQAAFRPAPPACRVSSPERNQVGVNVYIRNLPSNMSDETLFTLGQAYGTIVSSKSIIDRNTSMCRGFGFVMYQTAGQADSAIEGFTKLGFAASIARETANTRNHQQHFRQGKQQALPLQTSASNVGNHNVYLSNLPINMTEEGMFNMFRPYQVLNTKILTDPATRMSRRVGFARFTTYAQAQAVIMHYDRATLPGCSSPLQVRWADHKNPVSSNQNRPQQWMPRQAGYGRQNLQHQRGFAPRGGHQQMQNFPKQRTGGPLAFRGGYDIPGGGRVYGKGYVTGNQPARPLSTAEWPALSDSPKPQNTTHNHNDGNATSACTETAETRESSNEEELEALSQMVRDQLGLSRNSPDNGESATEVQE